MADIVRALPEVLPYPSISGIAVVTVLTVILLVMSGRFDKTGGPLTVSLMVILGMLGAVVYTLIFNVPHDELTSTLVGGLTAAFGGVIAYWLTRKD